MLLFVYGSLLRGEDNHAVLAGARFVATARTAPRYTLVDLGPYPALVPGGETEVSGELFEVGPALLTELDDF
ncbi:MAG: gamma-glutamylcyclotransferase family protein, partial [Polyangiaceae bacterium]